MQHSFLYLWEILRQSKYTQDTHGWVEIKLMGFQNVSNSIGVIESKWGFSIESNSLTVFQEEKLEYDAAPKFQLIVVGTNVVEVCHHLWLVYHS